VVVPEEQQEPVNLVFLEVLAQVDQAGLAGPEAILATAAMAVMRPAHRLVLVLTVPLVLAVAVAVGVALVGSILPTAGTLAL
jgi:hypothetical protein